jgi:hypothetical protein
MTRLLLCGQLQLQLWQSSQPCQTLQHKWLQLPLQLRAHHLRLVAAGLMAATGATAKAAVQSNGQDSQPMPELDTHLAHALTGEHYNNMMQQLVCET